MFYAKYGSKKQLIFENETIFKIAKNDHNAKGIAHAKYTKNKTKNKIAQDVSTNTLKIFYLINGRFAKVAKIVIFDVLLRSY